MGVIINVLPNLSVEMLSRLTCCLLLLLESFTPASTSGIERIQDFLQSIQIEHVMAFSSSKSSFKAFLCIDMQICLQVNERLNHNNKTVVLTSSFRTAEKKRIKGTSEGEKATITFLHFQAFRSAALASNTDYYCRVLSLLCGCLTTSNG